MSRKKINFSLVGIKHSSFRIVVQVSTTFARTNGKKVTLFYF